MKKSAIPLSGTRKKYAYAHKSDARLAFFSSQRTPTIWAIILASRADCFQILFPRFKSVLLTSPRWFRWNLYWAEPKYQEKWKLQNLFLKIIIYQRVFLPIKRKKSACQRGSFAVLRMTASVNDQIKTPNSCYQKCRCSLIAKIRACYNAVL